MKIIGHNHMRVSVSLQQYFSSWFAWLSLPGDSRKTIY
jgi:hypothetical protein